VPRNERHWMRSVPGNEVPIAVANADRPDLNEHFTGLRRSQLEFFDYERRMGTM
jgi:hypothetical protein